MLCRVCVCVLTWSVCVFLQGSQSREPGRGGSSPSSEVITLTSVSISSGLAEGEAGPSRPVRRSSCPAAGSERREPNRSNPNESRVTGIRM